MAADVIAGKPAPTGQVAAFIRHRGMVRARRNPSAGPGLHQAHAGRTSMRG